MSGPAVDPAFEVWLQTLPSLGYDRQWVIHNMARLHKRFRDTQGVPMPPCPEPTREPYDPYKGI